MPRWSPQQDRALTQINRWLRNPDADQFYLFGYAGAGKTEIAYEIGQGVSDVHYPAFTGKATHVLRQRGCSPASTIHRLITATSLMTSAAPTPASAKPDTTWRM